MSTKDGNTCWTGTEKGTQPAHLNTIDSPPPPPDLTKDTQEKSSGNLKNTAKNFGGKVRYSRIFKKVSSDGNLVLFLPQRELSVTEDKVEALMGVALIHENVMRVKAIKVFLQVVLIFRYVPYSLG